MTYKHDCKECVPLGKHNAEDLYFCNQGGAPTVIARFGNDGWDYRSGLDFAKTGKDEGLFVAMRRAKERGLLQ